MPRRRDNDKVNYNGSEISFDMAAQLEETNKNLKETLKLQREHTKELERQGKLTDELYRKRNAQYNRDKKMYDEMSKGLQLTKKEQEAIITNASKNTDIIGNSIANAQKNINSGRFTGLNSWYADRVERKQRETYQQIAQDLYNKASNNGSKTLNQKQYNKLREDVEIEFTKSLEKTTKKTSAIADIFKVATDTFNAAVQTWVGVAVKGRNNQTSVYENTFENISVRNGTTRSQYYGAQIGLQSKLTSAGVFDNIASSEVMNMWNTLANNGVKLDVSNAEQTAKAIETVITQHIVPYLDTTTKDFTILNARIGDKFIKDIRGINEYNMKVAGNSYQTQELLQEIIDQVQPMSDEAISNLAQGSAEVTAMINKLTPIMGADAAKSYATQLFKTQRYSDQIMRNGTLTERMSLYGAINNGINIYNPEHWNDYLGLAVNNSQMIRSWTPGYNSTLSGLITNVVGSATGEDYNRLWGAGNLTSKGLTGSLVASETNLTAAELQAIANAKTSAFTNSQNQTNTQLQNITVENFMNELAVVNEWLGNWTGVLETAIKGIGTLITTKIVGGIIGKGMGMLTGQGGLSLPNIGGIASSIGSVLTNPLTIMLSGLAAYVAGIYAINKHQDSKNIEGNNSVSKRQNSAVEGYMAEGLDEDTAYFKALGENTAIRGNIGVWNSDSEVAITPTTRAQLPNGQWYDKSTSVTDATDLVAKDALSVFDGIDDKTLKEEYGIELGWWFWEKDKSMKAREKLNEQIKLGKAADPSIYNKIKAAGLLNILNNNSDKMNYGDVAAALNLMMYYENKANDKYVTEAMDFLSVRNYATSKQSLQQMLDGLGISEVQTIKNAYKLLTDKQVDFYLMDSSRGFFPYPNTDADYEKMKKDFNLHRYGLASVPYDDYPALLHEGEAVLTATTAAELRNLLEEYRETSQQSINFDTIIQNQTNALIVKMSEIITTIEQTNSSFGNFNTSNDMAKAKNILSNSMKHMQSTKSF